MGLSVVLVERDREPYQLPRAIVMDDEIQRLLIDHGMGEWLAANTSALQRGDFVGANDEVLLGADIPPVGLQGVAPVVVHFQPHLDTMLRAEFVGRGGDARFGRTVVDMVDDGDVVTTTLDDETVVTSRWFIGCDGASSWTRKHVGLVLEDLEFDQEWLVVDIELQEGAAIELPVGVRQYCRAERPCTHIQGVRRFHAVVAPMMQKGNVFLAGDAAHQMPPFAGQGLNSGMRDAVNLAWKMAFVHRGLMGTQLLEQYSIERVPHVRSSVAGAVDMGRLIDQLAGRKSHGVGLDSGYGGTRSQPHIEAGMLTGDDPRVGHQLSFHPGVSQAVATNGACFVVMVAQIIDLPPALRKLGAKVVVAPDAVTNAYAIVVRPDRYVAAVAKSAAELGNWLRGPS